MDYSKYLNSRSAALVLSFFTVFFLVQFSGFLSFGQGFNGVQFATCTVNQEGDITGCEMWNEHFREDLEGSFTAEDAKFWVEIVDADEGDEHAPQAYWLYRNGFKGDIDPEHRGELENIHLANGDLEWNSEIKASMEMATTCKATFDVASHGEFRIETTEEAQDYNDEPDSGERHGRYFMEAVTVYSEDVRFENQRMYCQFDMADVFNQGMELDGEFVSWNGRYPALDEVGAYGRMQKIDFEVDSDGDGVLEVNDNCPSQGEGDYGLTENGCPVERSDLPDSDGDGVKDRFDSAPNVYGSSIDGSPTILENYVRKIPGLGGWRQDSSLVSGVRIGSWF